MSAEPCAPSALVYRPEIPSDGSAVEALLDCAFGPGRFVKISERVREFADFAPELSVCALAGERLVGVCRIWRVRVGEDRVAFLGPLAVDPEARSVGLGAELVARACAAAEAAGEAGVLLVGDEPFFRKLGFAPAPGVVLPGPVDQRRVLTLAFDGGGFTGPVRPR